ncbi:GroES chaperonin family [uncultured Caudovirales phage]|uniref:GroES chaperonin family n=1 Tax=uncultured Caudovirales phage TaxID=2100421 RepID=A0A6J5R775_9CAUD|nr:GroES chaperonin family [uncultured Caudovirales phage]CAB4176381.1 GroES chaperonin family [uncultured Caudovirales phage]CAB4189478.1 GroES chaperonin family [uncultured Caudovirales phage]
MANLAVVTNASAQSPLDLAFPNIDPGIEPFGSRVLVQIRGAKRMSKGGIIFTADTKDTEKWNTQVGKVIATGPLAFRNRETMEPWVEGRWCELGDFVRCGKHGGDRWEVQYGDKEETALFVIFNDLDIIGKITGDPLAIKAFV